MEEQTRDRQQQRKELKRAYKKAKRKHVTLWKTLAII